MFNVLYIFAEKVSSEHRLPSHASHQSITPPLPPLQDARGHDEIDLLSAWTTSEVVAHTRKKKKEHSVSTRVEMLAVIAC